jgi:enoyl-CoA hydratase/carnithine racemase
MIELSSQDGVALLRMADGKANTMSTEFCRELAARIEEAGRSTARAVVITGNGRIFSAGVDLVRLLDGGVPYVREFLPALSAMLRSVFVCPKPVVAAINGHAIAGGCVLACAADRRLMAREAGRIGVTELLVGVPFPPAAMEVMRSAVAPQYFEDTILSGATFAHADAVARGLVHDIVEPDALLDRAFAAAGTLAALPAAAFALSKRQMREPSLQRIDDKEVDAAIARIWEAPETLGRVRDYVARTLRKS